MAREIGYPVLVRPSYVLGGRGMEIVYDDETLATYVTRATVASPEHPVLVDRFLDDAIEIDVDALYDGTDMYLGGIMEHIEEAGIHSGDSACTLPPGDPRRRRAGAGPRGHPQAGRGHRRARPDERPVRPGPGHPLRPRGQPARVAHRAVRRQGDRRPGRQGRRPGHARRHASRSCARRACSRRTATAARCRATPRWRSRRRCCRSSGSAPATARSSTACSAPRCARPARSWASTRTSGRRSPRACSRPAPGCRARAGSSSRSPTATSAP